MKSTVRRASLDFLPMRLSVFQARAEQAFPTACDELEMRRTALEGSYKKLEKDAESLRKELGEDKWVLVFRGAGRQAGGIGRLGGGKRPTVQVVLRFFADLPVAP